jgi:hypothetical protein
VVVRTPPNTNKTPFNPPNESIVFFIVSKNLEKPLFKPIKNLSFNKTE